MAGLFPFSSETSLGWVRSAASNMGLSYGTLLLPSGSSAIGTVMGVQFLGPAGTNVFPTYGFSNETRLGLYRSQNSTIEITFGQFVVNSGSALRPGLATNSERSLGIWRSGVSTLAMSYGALAFPAASNTTPSITFSSETSLGFYRSATSTIATSYGTLNLAANSGHLWASGISVGGGTLIPVISSISSLVGAFVVQPSASSFTGIAWTGVAIGDIILVGVFQSTAASSISSGLVFSSHVTVANQIEFRLSNVSTLVQNQSAQTWVFTRIRPF